MTITPEEARRLAEQTEHPTPWKWADGPNPIVGEYVDDATATTRFGTEKRIKILRDADGKRWAVWLLGQLDVQWDEADPKPEHGDHVAVWVRPGERVVSANGNEYRPSRITVSKTGSPATADAARASGGPGRPADAGAAQRAGEPRQRVKELMTLLGGWPPTQAATQWVQTVGVDQAVRMLETRAREQGLIS